MRGRRSLVHGRPPLIGIGQPPTPSGIHREVDRHPDETVIPVMRIQKKRCDGERGDDQADARCDVQRARMVPGATSALMKKRPKATVAGVNHEVSHIQNRSVIRTV